MTNGSTHNISSLRRQI